MPQANLNVTLLTYTPSPAQTIAQGSRLCYSASSIDELKKQSEEMDTQAFISRLTGYGHLSPVEHASFTFGIEGVSRALLAQITRHRIASFSVQSQRYVKAEELDYIVPPTIQALGEEAVEKYGEQMRTLHGWYKEWLELTGKAEDARFVLPNAAATRMIVTMNARELMHFFSLRCCNRAQWEIRTLAWAMLGMARRACGELFSNAGPGCVYGACSEGKMSCKQAERIRSLSAELNELIFKGGSDAEILNWAKTNIERI